MWGIFALSAAAMLAAELVRAIHLAVEKANEDEAWRESSANT